MFFLLLITKILSLAFLLINQFHTMNVKHVFYHTFLFQSKVVASAHGNTVHMAPFLQFSQCKRNNKINLNKLG